MPSGEVRDNGGATWLCRASTEREDEPVFILRAQDRLAEPTVEMYRLLAASHGCELAQSLPQEIDRFRQWKGARKLPD